MILIVGELWQRLDCVLAGRIVSSTRLWNTPPIVPVNSKEDENLFQVKIVRGELLVSSSIWASLASSEYDAASSIGQCDSTFTKAIPLSAKNRTTWRSLVALHEFPLSNIGETIHQASISRAICLVIPNPHRRAMRTAKAQRPHGLVFSFRRPLRQRLPHAGRSTTSALTFRLDVTFTEMMLPLQVVVSALVAVHHDAEVGRVGLGACGYQFRQRSRSSIPQCSVCFSTRTKRRTRTRP